MLGCKQNKANSVDESPVQLSKQFCPDVINEVMKLNGKTAMQVASKLVELNAQKPDSADKTTSCLDDNLKIVCNQTKCTVAKKDI